MKRIGGALIGSGEKNCIIKFNGRIYRMALNAKEAHETYQKEMQIKKLLMSRLSKYEFESRFVFASDEHEALTDFKQLSKRDPEVAKDYEKCIQQNENSDYLLSHGTLSPDHPILITYYPELESIKYPISKKNIEFLRESMKILHSEGIYHGDLHAQNAMYNKETNSFVIIDWDNSEMNASRDMLRKDLFTFENDLEGHNNKEIQQQKRNEEIQKRRLAAAAAAAEEPLDVPSIKRTKLDF